MRLFRSEEHVARWLGGRAAEETIGVTTLCDLAHAWWGDRLAPGWRPRTREESQAVLDGVGLTGEFWRLE